jgi:hypothetical protein
MLGDGSILDVDEKDGKVPELLWALRGGGGLSYGILTELRIQTFALPKELIKFELHWNHYDEREEYPQEDYLYSYNSTRCTPYCPYGIRTCRP